MCGPPRNPGLVKFRFTRPDGTLTKQVRRTIPDLTSLVSLIARSHEQMQEQCHHSES